MPSIRFTDSVPMCLASLLLVGCYEVHEQGEEPGPDPGPTRPVCGVEGQRCDSEPGDGDRVCFYRDGDATTPVAEVVYRFETTSLGDSLRVALVLNESFVDNTWGARSSDGYRGGDDSHTLHDLLRSDHAQFALLDADGRNALELKIDYLSEAEDMASGYRSLGVWGGDGRIVSGYGRGVLFATSSLDDNVNLRGCAADESSSPGPDDCPGWENRVIYTAWVSLDTFAPSTFGRPSLDHVHASPSRMSDTLEVSPGPCPD